MTHEHDALMERLVAAAARVDSPPPAVTAGARAAFTWRSVDAELAELVYDSRLDEHLLAGVRAGAGARRLTFDGAGLTVEVEVETMDGAGQLIGQVVPARPGTVEVRHATQSLAVPVDGLGRFSVDRLPRGHISLRCRTEGGPIVDTAWILP